jgi:hypothetical protein
MTNSDDIIDIEPEAIVEAPAPVPAKKKRGKLSLLIAGLLTSAVAGGWFYRDVLSSYLPSDQVTSMAARIDALEATARTLNDKVDAAIGFNDEMKSNLAAAQVSAADVSQLKSDSAASKSKLENLQAALAATAKQIDEFKTKLASGPITATPADMSRIESLEKDLASLKQSGGSATDTVLLSQSLSDLKAKIAAGVSYKSEFDRIKNLVPAAEGLDVLQAQAASGIANTETLATELQRLTFPTAEATPTAANQSWWDYAGSLVSSVVTIKSSGTSDWAPLANQVADLAKQGDLPSAIASLEKAEGALPLNLQSWHDKATARVAVEQALEKTSAAVLRQIAAKG